MSPPNKITTIKIDRTNPLPLYAQLKYAIVERIEAGELQPGVQLPSEEELTAQTGLSRFTVRQALDELAQEGRVQRVHGKGTFVTARKISLSVAYKLVGFSEDMAEKGYRVQSQVIENRLVPAPQEAAGALGIVPGTPAVLLRRLRLVDGQPFMVDTIHLRSDLCPGFEALDMTDRSLFRELDARYGLKIVRARRTLSIVVAEPWAAELLGLRECSPVHLLTDLAYVQTGEAVEYAQTLVHGERSEFSFELVRDWESGNQWPVSADSTNPIPRRDTP